MNLSEYRQSDSERQRTKDLMQHIKQISGGGKSVLDIGARDSHFLICWLNCSMK